MNARIAFTLSFIQLLSINAFSQERAGDIAPRKVTDRIIVQYNEKPTPANAMGFIKQGVTYGGFGVAAGKQKDILEMDASVDINDAITLSKGLENDPQVKFAEPDYIMQIMQAPNDDLFNQQWHLHEPLAGANLIEAWDRIDYKPQAPVIVGVVDTGILNHDDIDGNLLKGYDFASNPWISNDGDGRDNDPTDPGDAILAIGACGYSSGQPVPAQRSESSWHGTHVAGTIAAETNNAIGVAGVAPNAKVMALRALGRCGGYTSDIIDAMRWGAGLRVYGMDSNPTPVNVLNLSLGGFSVSCPRSYQKAIDEVVAAGVTVVVAAGNENLNARFSTPANCNNVITVASINREGNRSWYSNYGRFVDIAAPGGETRYYGNGILSTSNSGKNFATENNYEFYQGTSMATPHVAGVAALIYSLRPDISPARVEELIKNNARPFPAGSCNTQLCGAGILDAGASVRDALDE